MAKEDFIPVNYEEWKYCITVKCGIPITKKFIEERLNVFNDSKHEYTTKFTELYGSHYTEQVVTWLETAKNEFRNR